MNFKKIKSESGITLTSLIVYVIVMVLVVSTLTVLTSFFFSNISVIGNDDKYLKQYSKLSEYLVEESNMDSNSLYKVGEEQGVDLNTNLKKYNRISFYNSNNNEINTYQFIDNSLYRNEFKICENVKEGFFLVDNSNPSYIKVILNIKFGEDGKIEKNDEYVLKIK